MERLIAGAVDSPATERLVARVIESRLLDETFTRLLESQDLWLLVVGKSVAAGVPPQGEAKELPGLKGGALEVIRPGRGSNQQ